MTNCPKCGASDYYVSPFSGPSCSNRNCPDPVVKLESKTLEPLPTMSVDEAGTKLWSLDGKRHRLDGPAIEYAHGTKKWFVDGKRHRLDGPAIEWANGSKSWWVDGKRHRLDGPAVEYANGYKEWWVTGQFIKSMAIALLFLTAFFSSSACADAPLPTEDLLARSIFRAKTGARGDLRWRECNTYIRRELAAERAHEYASYLMEQYTTDQEFDPWIAAAIMAQESSFNRCAISRGAWRHIRTQFPTEFGRPITESDLQRILRSRRLRDRLGVRRFDAGLAQFRWPGTTARQAGMTDPAALLNARQNIRLLAISLRFYRRTCDATPRFTGYYRSSPRASTGRVRVIRYNVPCSSGYWVRHNTGGSWFNYRYYRNVNRWFTRLTEEFSNSTTIDEYYDAE